MFRRISLGHYRSIEEAQLTLGPFGLVVGPNGSGKSNFVDAFVFVRDLAFDAATAISSRGGISSVRQWSRSKPYDVRVKLRLAEREAQLESRFLEHSVLIQSLADGQWRFKKEHVEYRDEVGSGWSVEREGSTVTCTGVKLPVERLADTTSVMFLVRQLLPLPAPFRKSFTNVRRYRLNPEAMRQPQLVTESGRLSESGVNVATTVRRMGDLDEILRPMQRIVPGLVAINPVEAGRHLLLNFIQQQGSGKAEFTASEVSEGALRALGVILAAKQMAKGDLVIIEEPEANVHAGAARLIFEVLKDASNKGSVLLTSHSPELLDAAREESIIVCDYREGVTRLGPLAQSQRRLVREGLFRLAELVRTEPLRIEGDSLAVAEP